jgi:hypothetical protein
MQPLALEQQPFFKGLAPGQVEAGQKGAAVERGGLSEVRVASGAGGGRAVAVGAAGGQVGGECGDIELDCGGGIEVHRLGGDEQDPGGALLLAQGLT